VDKLSDDVMAMLLEHVFLVSPAFKVHSLELPLLMDRAVFTGTLGDDFSASQALAVLENDVKLLGLDKDVRLFIFPNPASADDRSCTVVVLRRDCEPEQSISTVFFSTMSGAITVATSLFYAKSLYGSPVGDMNEFSVDFARLTAPFWTVFLSIILAGELANRIVAGRNKTRLFFPLLLPSLQIGTFGRLFSFNRSFPRNRQALFDIIAAGQVTSIGLSISTMVVGLQATASHALSGVPFPEVSGSLFTSSWLTNTIATAVLKAPPVPDQNIALHPLFLAGYTSMLICALNMIPVGKVDGGLISQALLGRFRASFVSGVSGVLLGILSLVSFDSDVLFFWFLLVFFLQRRADYPQHDEVTEVRGAARWLIATALFATSIAFLVPSNLFSG